MDDRGVEFRSAVESAVRRLRESGVVPRNAVLVVEDGSGNYACAAHGASTSPMSPLMVLALVRDLLKSMEVDASAETLRRDAVVTLTGLIQTAGIPDPSEPRRICHG